MHAIACIRQVPDYEAPAELFTVEGSPPRIVAAREVKTVIGLFDNHALEAALRLKDAHGGTVTALTLGPPGALDALKRALHMGADAAVLVDEGPYGDLDAAATATVLAPGASPTPCLTWAAPRRPLHSRNSSAACNPGAAGRGAPAGPCGMASLRSSCGPRSRT